MKESNERMKQKVWNGGLIRGVTRELIWTGGERRLISLIFLKNLKSEIAQTCVSLMVPPPARSIYKTVSSITRIARIAGMQRIT